MNQSEFQNSKSPELSSLAERLGQKSENLGSPEIVAQADSEMLDTLLFGKSEAKSPTGGAVLQLQMAKAQPQKIKSLVSANFSKRQSSSKRLKDAKKARVNQALRNFGQNPTDDPQQFVPATPSSIASSLTTVMTGQTQQSSSDYQSLVESAKAKFIKYMLKIMSSKDSFMASRVYAIHHFNDPAIFDKFEGLEEDLMLAYNRFLGLVSQANAVQIPQPNPQFVQPIQNLHQEAFQNLGYPQQPIQQQFYYPQQQTVQQAPTYYQPPPTQIYPSGQR
jgi:hypothetical protein